MTHPINRRNFLIALGAGAAAITGYFVFQPITSEHNGNGEACDYPALSGNVSKSYRDNKLLLTAGNGTQCFVNKTGEKITELMDGKNDFQQICTLVSTFYSIQYTDALAASVANFICQLGAAGFLVSPFYVTMYETC